MKHKILSNIEKEQKALSHWWITHTQDRENGGFYGAIDNANRIIPEATKGTVQNARILWYFSEAARITENPNEHHIAQRAFAFFIEKFWDKQNHGVVWELDCRGRTINSRKQIYAQAFAIYALSSYHQLTGDTQALDLAQAMFNLIEKHARDFDYGGYLEAFGPNWQNIDDVRLSDRDLNWPKTMNTHLHLLEAYSEFYKVAPSQEIANALKELIRTFLDHFISNEYYLKTFFDYRWNDKSEAISYGHDIECSWLLWRAATILNDPDTLTKLRPKVISIAENCLHHGIDASHGMRDGQSIKTGHLLNEHVWWVQAEAMVGFLNAYEMTHEEYFWRAFENSWRFIQQYQIDQTCGEWFWFSKLTNSKGVETRKSCFWKGPYHNGRALLESAMRLRELNDTLPTGFDSTG